MRKLGFVIANDREEFLVYEGGNSSAWARAWSPLPSMAKAYTRREAEKLANSLEVPYPVWVLQLIETDNHYLVSSANGSGPDWLHR